MFKRFVGVVAAAAACAGMMTVSPSQATRPIAEPAAGELDPMFVGERRLGFNLKKLKPLTKPVQLANNTHLQSMAVIGRRIVAAGLYVDTSNLAITLIDGRGRRVGAMSLYGVGHGTSIAARVVRGRIIIWVEADSDRGDAAGRGRALARVVFRNGARYHTRQLERMRPADGSAHVNPTIDHATNTLAVRYRLGGGTYLDRYDLNAASRGVYKKVSQSIVPLPCDERLGVIQGWTVSGDYVYCLQGGTGQRTHVGWKNWKTWTERRYVVNFGAGNPTREAEGLTTAYYKGRKRVMLGLAMKRGAARYAVVLTST